MASAPRPPPSSFVGGAAERPSVSSGGLAVGAFSPESLGEGASLEPLGSLAYLDLKSEFAFHPHFELPLPSVGLTPRLAAYPFAAAAPLHSSSRHPKSSTRSGEAAAQAEGQRLWEDGEDVANAFDAAFAQQLLTVFDAAGLVPNLINPFGYPQLLVDSTHASFAAPPGSGRPEEGLKARLEALAPEDLALVVDVLPEIPETARRALKARLSRSGKSPSPSPAVSTTASFSRPSSGTAEASTVAKSEAAAARGASLQSLCHPSKPHLLARRVLEVRAHPHAGRCRLDHLSLDLAASEARDFCAFRVKSSEAAEGEAAAKKETAQDEQDARALPPASLLVPEEDAPPDSRTLSLYVLSGESTESPPQQQGDSPESPESPLKAAETSRYKFLRDYVLQPSPSPSAGAERSVLFLVPPSKAEAPEDGGENACLLLPLPGPRRVLLKAGGLQKRPPLAVEWSPAVSAADWRGNAGEEEAEEGAFCLAPPPLRKKPRSSSAAFCLATRPAPDWTRGSREGGAEGELFQGEDSGFEAGAVKSSSKGDAPPEPVFTDSAASLQEQRLLKAKEE